ncbi:Phosphoethanolamine/phosphocholine phosphatase [Orchesella cincta]|uniref:Phosphoethanolamine/phosphocholine phosphatase n=1 Tax=Orchesella cincta TaxID=48709 RepID=A0A1D2MY23_ORCCI|nr:Phosphoethanolamine/phosphocholine phosphatase [Orchesella cincta]
MSGANDNQSYEEENDNDLKCRSSRDHSYLFAFDFDHTIVNLNSDFEIHKATDTPLPNDIRPKGITFMDYMNRVFRFLHDQNVSIADLREFIRKLEPTKGMVNLLMSLVKYKQSHEGNRVKLLVISDANDLTIGEWLKAQIIDQLPSTPTTHFPFDVITNKSIIHEAEDLLQVSAYEHQTTCKICPQNLCKGSAIKNYIDRNGPFKMIYYAGDGWNDVCPILGLGPQSFVFPRINYEMFKWLHKNENQSRVKAKIVCWEDADVIHNTIRLHVNGFK